MITFDDRAQLAKELSSRVAGCLKKAIASKGIATLAVSGGSTPLLLFETLSREQLDWRNVKVTLVDERWVDETSKRSNARLVKTNLLKHEAANAEFAPLFIAHSDIEIALPKIETTIKKLSLPFDGVILGMGTDGHTASFFPNGKNLDMAVDPSGSKLLSAVYADAAGEPRITLNLPVLVSAKFLALHIEGEEKLDVLHNAQGDGHPNNMPVRHILNHANQLEIFWSP